MPKWYEFRYDAKQEHSSWHLCLAQRGEPVATVAHHNGVWRGSVNGRVVLTDCEPWLCRLRCEAHLLGGPYPLVPL